MAVDASAQLITAVYCSRSLAVVCPANRERPRSLATRAAQVCAAASQNSEGLGKILPWSRDRSEIADAHSHSRAHAQSAYRISSMNSVQSFKSIPGQIDSMCPQIHSTTDSSNISLHIAAVCSVYSSETKHTRRVRQSPFNAFVVTQVIQAFFFYEQARAVSPLSLL